MSPSGERSHGMSSALTTLGNVSYILRNSCDAAMAWMRRLAVLLATWAKSRSSRILLICSFLVPIGQPAGPSPPPYPPPQAGEGREADGLPEWQSNSRFAVSTRRIASLPGRRKRGCTLARSCRAFGSDRQNRIVNPTPPLTAPAPCAPGTPPCTHAPKLTSPGRAAAVFEAASMALLIGSRYGENCVFVLPGSRKSTLSRFDKTPRIAASPFLKIDSRLEMFGAMRPIVKVKLQFCGPIEAANIMTEV